VPDTTAGAGDQVMAAVELRPGAAFDPDGFAAWLAAQPDLGTKWAPRYVRVSPSLPQTANGKVTKASLRDDGWHGPDPIWWRPDGGGDRYQPLTPDDRAGLDAALAAQRPG
jgi:fatty-acyl-CoA synthase